MDPEDEIEEPFDHSTHIPAWRKMRFTDLLDEPISRPQSVLTSLKMHDVDILDRDSRPRPESAISEASSAPSLKRPTSYGKVSEVIDLEVRIPLASDSRISIAQHSEVLKKEFAIRYLEKFGIPATPHYVAQLFKQVPWEECKISTVLAPAYLKDKSMSYISIRHPPPKPRDTIDPHFLPIFLQKGSLGIDSFPDPEETLSLADPTEIAPSKKVLDFDTYKKRFMYPYNIAPQLEKAERDKFVKMASRSGVDIPALPTQKLDPMRFTSGSETPSSTSSSRASEIDSRSSPNRRRRSSAMDSARSLRTPLSRPTSHASSTASPVQPHSQPPPPPTDDSESPMVTRAELSHIVDTIADAHEQAALQQQTLSSSPTPPLTVLTTDLALPPGGANTASGSVSPSRRMSTRSAANSAVTAGSTSRRPIKHEKADPATVGRELSMPPHMGPKQLWDILDSFFSIAPLSKWESRFKPEELDRAKRDLHSMTLATFLVSFCDFLYWLFLADLVLSEKRKDRKFDKNARFLEVYEDVLDLLGKRKTEGKDYTRLQLPLLILATRVSVETVFRVSYPLWYHNYPDSRRVLEQMDSFVAALFDPHLYFSQISTLESSPDAVLIASKNHKMFPKSAVSTSYAISPMIQSIVDHPGSDRTRAFLSLSKKYNKWRGMETKSEVLESLIPSLRQSIYQIMIKKNMLEYTPQYARKRTPTPSSKPPLSRPPTYSSERLNATRGTISAGVSRGSADVGGRSLSSGPTLSRERDRLASQPAVRFS